MFWSTYFFIKNLLWYLFLNLLYCLLFYWRYGSYHSLQNTHNIEIMLENCPIEFCVLHIHIFCNLLIPLNPEIYLQAPALMICRLFCISVAEKLSNVPNWKIQLQPTKGLVSIFCRMFCLYSLIWWITKLRYKPSIE